MRRIFLYLSVALSLIASPALTQDITPFVGQYSGSAEMHEGDTAVRRDMSAEIKATPRGFSVSWTSATYRADGRTKVKSYTIDFVPSQRESVYASAMKTNLFGKQVPLNPLEGEPFVWARLLDDKLSVFSLFINEVGDYEMQEYHRSLIDDGLLLEFRRLRNGAEQRTVRTKLQRR